MTETLLLYVTVSMLISLIYTDYYFRDNDDPRLKGLSTGYKIFIFVLVSILACVFSPLALYSLIKEFINKIKNGGFKK